MKTSFNHSGGSISVEGSSSRYRGGAPDVCGDCSPLDTLLGSGTTLVDFPRFALLRCLVSLPFSPGGRDILDISLVFLLIFGNRVDLPSNGRCDLRLGRLHSVRWKHCRDELLSATEWRCHGLWGVGECGLNAQCLQSERFLGVNSCGSKRRFEGNYLD